MKIACIIHSLHGGGAERVMAGLTSRLANRGHEVTLITLDDGRANRSGPSSSGPRAAAVDERVICHPLDVISDGGNLFTRLQNTRRRIRTLRSAIDQSAAEVVLSFCDQTNLLTLLATEHRELPVVVSERSDPAQQTLGPIWERLRKSKYKRATEVVALTEPAADYLRQLTGRSVVVIPSAVDRPPTLSRRTTAQSNRRIVGLGRLEHEKGFDRLLDAFSQLVQQHPELKSQWNLRIIGEGSMRGQLQRQIEELDLTEDVSLPGWIDPVWSELAAATLFVLPSRYEGFPSALLEAMAVGVPSLAVDCESGPRAVLKDQVNGMLVDNQVPALTEGMWRMIGEEAWRERLGERGRQVVDDFSWEAMVDAYEQLLRQARDQATGPSG